MHQNALVQHPLPAADCSFQLMQPFLVSGLVPGFRAPWHENNKPFNSVSEEPSSVCQSYLCVFLSHFWLHYNIMRVFARFLITEILSASSVSEPSSHYCLQTQPIFSLSVISRQLFLPDFQPLLRLCVSNCET